MTTPGPKKPKIQIKPFRHQVQMDPDYATKTWKLLSGAIQEIHRKNASGLSFEELYRNAYNMVLHKYGDVLYNGLKEVVDTHLIEVAGKVSAAIDENFLTELNSAWDDHKLSMLMIRDILMYMDRVYVTQHNVATVYDLGLRLFRERIAQDSKTKDRIRQSLLSLVYRERTGEQINRSLVKNITQMLIDVGVNSRTVYEEDFEKYFLEESQKFYRLESQEFLDTNTCPDYLRKIESRIKEELERVNHYLDASTEGKIKDVVERELITNHMKYLAEIPASGLEAMLRENKTEDLRRMYLLFGRVGGGHQIMRDLIARHIKDQGAGLMNDEEKQKDHLALVQLLLEMKDKHDRILQEAFHTDRGFSQTINQAFEHFINQNPKSPEYISLFIDEKLKKGLKGVTEAEVDAILDKVMTLFRFIQEKDVFEKYYKQHLAKRLLLGRSLSDDAERNMISKLKTECGYQFTSKLEGMFTDMKVSSETMEAFRQWVKDSGKPEMLAGVDVSVSVLTTGYWPTQASQRCNLPAEIVKCCEAFQNYYLRKHSGRRLTWQTNMGSAELRANFPKKKHELSVSTYQMVVLMLYNEKDSYTFRELRETTQIPINDLKRTLLSLINVKNKVLERKSGSEPAAGGKAEESASAKPAPVKLEDSDLFIWNAKFTSKLFKVKVMTVQQKETETESQETRQKVDEDRKHQIEAAIVRIMKARKTMEHSNLISEVTKQLSARFMPNPNVIKKRIESLIEREYLERSKNDRKVYNYLA